MSELEPLSWTTKQRRVSELIPQDFNPRIMTDEKREKLERSILKFNLAEIPIANADNTLLGGHQRVIVLLILGRGEELIDVRIPNRMLTDAEAKEYMIISNTHAGQFDWDKIEMYFEDIDFEDIGFDLPDFGAPMEQLPEDLVDDFTPPEIDKVKTEIVEGDVIVIGDHHLVCGDSTKPATWRELMAGSKADLLITDPPYNVNYDAGGTREGIANDDMPDEEFAEFIQSALECAYYGLKPGAVCYVWHADSKGHIFRQAFLNAGMKLAQVLIWVKNTFTMGRQDYQWCHEPCLYGWKTDGGHTWYADRSQSTVLNHDKPSKSAEHPTMKPVELINELVRNSSKQGQMVADGFGGSGTSLGRAPLRGRTARISGLEPKDCRVIVER
ncbi:MAG: DNA methylase, partial [Flavobacteriales bacterium]|nr:DNA methylase [Flavobacteriales bacterium]